MAVNNNLGNVYLAKELYKEAIRHFEIALEEAQNDPDIRYNLAIAYIEDQQFMKAQEELAKLVRISPTYWDAYYQQGLLQINEGNEEVANVIFQSLLEQYPAYERRAEIEDLMGNN